MGSGHLHYPARECGLGYVRIAGKFAPQGTGAPTVTGGVKFSVARAAAGRWTVTINSAVNVVGLIVPSVHLELQAADGDTHTTYVANINETAKTFDICHKAAADTATAEPVLADISAHAEHAVHFECIVATTSAQGSGF